MNDESNNYSIITKQGKHFNMGDVLLCSKQGNKLFLLLNDKEQLDLFTKSGNSLDAPVCMKDYNIHLESLIYMSKKKIKDYDVLDNGNTSVTFEDESTFEFSESSKNIIVENYKKQDVAQNAVVGNWSDDNTQELRHKIKEVKKYDKEIKNASLALKVNLFAAIFSYYLIASHLVNLYGNSLISTLTYVVFGLSIGIKSGLGNRKANFEKLKTACISELHDLGISDDEINQYLDIEKGKTK